MLTPASRPLEARAHSRTSRIAVSEAPAWLRSLTPELKDGHDVVLVVAAEPMQQQLVDMLRPVVREVLVASGLLDATQLLQRRGEHIAAAIISSQPGWGPKLRALLAAEYPAIRRVVLIS